MMERSGGPCVDEQAELIRCFVHAPLTLNQHWYPRLLRLTVSAAADDDDGDDEYERTVRNEFIRVSSRLVRFIFFRSYNDGEQREVGEVMRRGRRVMTSMVIFANKNLHLVSFCSAALMYNNMSDRNQTLNVSVCLITRDLLFSHCIWLLTGRSN